MFDQNLRMSLEDQQQVSPIRKHATFGEDQLDSRQHYLQQAREAAAAEQEEEDRVRLKSGAGSAVKAFEPNGSEHDKILEYGA